MKNSLKIMKIMSALFIILPVILLTYCGGGGGETIILPPSPWSYPAGPTDNISPDGSDVDSPEISMDDNGNAIIVWRQLSGANEALFMSEYRNGTWSHPADLNDYISPDGNSAYGIEVAMDNNGNAIIAWNGIYKSEYRNGAWTHPADLTDTISQSANSSPEVAMDDNGNAIIVWSIGTFHIYMSEYRNGEWTTPAKINPSGNNHAHSPQVAMDNNGNAIIVWEQYLGNYRIYKSEYRNGTWTHPTDIFDYISPYGIYSTKHPEVAMDNNGNAIIVWSQWTGTDSQIFMSEYRDGTWKHPADLTDNISPDGGGTERPQIAMDNNGNAIIVWSQGIDTDLQIFMSEYRNGTWKHSADLTDYINFSGGNSGHSDLAMDDNGNTIIIWNYFISGIGSKLFMSEYRNNTWTHPADFNDSFFTEGSSNGGYSYKVAMDNNGNAIIVWVQSDGNNNQIFKSEFR